MSDEFDPDTFKNKMERIDEIRRRIWHDKVQLIASEFQTTITSMIYGDMFNLREDLSGGANKNKRAYQNRKKNLGGSTTPLIFRSQYVESIKVFADREGFDEHGARKEEQNDENAPRFYVGCEEYNGIYGYYVDVEDVYHDPSPLAYTPLSTLLNAYNKKIQQGKDVEENIKNIKRTRRTVEYVTAPSAGVPMRWLKTALEFGFSKTVTRNGKDYIQGMPPRYHWGHVIEIFRQEYGTDEDIFKSCSDDIREAVVSELGINNGE